MNNIVIVKYARIVRVYRQTELVTCESVEHAIMIASDTEFRLIIPFNDMTSYHNAVCKIAITKVGHLTWPVSVCYYSCIKSKSTKFLIMYRFLATNQK